MSEGLPCVLSSGANSLALPHDLSFVRNPPPCVSEDNGVGFDPAAASAGIGLTAM
jgi:hypothetical protein